ncbi:hypothetical protein CTAYLR_009941 [Chrysophaeum taylorii]|uniref:PDZ domain-containing protein n=1 Tax=Chrysophaeum taylorii TaxID=2483200 RepID=A0AAD7UF12_9STRA|nr:hypothetical protein CTAYLR_009941 [Chrysophaeum taylorii]
MMILECVVTRTEAALGLDCGQHEGEEGLWIRAILANSPASKAQPQLFEGDRIVGIDGESLEGLDFAEAISRIRDAGPVVRITVERHAAFSLDAFVFEIAPRLLAVASSCPFASLARAPPRGLLKTKRRGRVRVWDLGCDDAPAHAKCLRSALQDASYDAFGWISLARLPALSHAVKLGAAVGAWLRASDNIAVLCDTSGANLRVALGAATAMRIGARIVAHDLDDSAFESYDRYLDAADLRADLSLDKLPPSFKRWLTHLDVALLSRRAPNPAPLVVIGVEASSPATPLALDNPSFDVADLAVSANLRPAAPSTDRLLVAYSAVVVRDEFSVTLRSGRYPVLRFASSTAFLDPGEPRVPRAALDIFPNYRRHVPADFYLVLRLAPSNTSDAPPRLLIPENDAALLALGTHALLGDA